MSDATRPASTLIELATILARHTYRYAHEVHLHEVLDGVLTQAGYAFEREVVFDRANRADFFLREFGVVIEVKVDGSMSAALRQVSRYCALDCVRGVLLAATNAWAATPLPALPELHGKAFLMCQMQRRFL